MKKIKGRKRIKSTNRGRIKRERNVLKGKSMPNAKKVTAVALPSQTRVFSEPTTCYELIGFKRDTIGHTF